MRLCVAILLTCLMSGYALADELKIFAKIEGPPKHYLDDMGEPSGYAIEIAAEAVRRAGFTPKIHNLPWNRAVKASQAGDGIITAFSKTEARQTHFLFTDYIFIDRVLIWTSTARDMRFEVFDDLTGKTIGIARGSRYSGEFEQYRPQMTLYEDSHHVNRLRMLLSGRIDAAIFSGDTASVRYLANRDGIDLSQLRPLQKPISIDPNHLGVPRRLKATDPDHLLSKLNAAIAEMKSDGTISEILASYR